MARETTPRLVAIGAAAALGLAAVCLARRSRASRRPDPAREALLESRRARMREARSRLVAAQRNDAA